MGRVTTIRGDQVVRQPDFVSGENPEIPEGFEDNAQYLIWTQLRNIAEKVYDTTRKIDEWQYGASATQIEVLPEFELPEVIESILIIAPAGAVTLTLGNRVWSVTVPSSGYVILAPVAIRLDRHDRRLLSVGSAGAIGLELMGHVDVYG